MMARKLTAGPSAETCRVPIVDGQPDIVDELIAHLSDKGHRCFSALNAVEALGMTELHPDIGIVLTGIRMPGMGGAIGAANGEQGAVFAIVLPDADNAGKGTSRAGR